MQRILIFSLAYHPHVGGAEVSIKEITDRISRQDIAFDMLTLRLDKRDPLVETIGNIRIYRVVGWKWTFPILAAIGARRLHKKNHYNGAWAMMTYMALPAYLSGIPYAITLQDGDTEAHVFGRLRILPFLPLLRAAFTNARALSALATFLVTWARKMGYQGEAVVIPQGADIGRFAKDPSLRRDEHDPNSSARDFRSTILITSSRLVHKNGIDTVIRALAHLPGVEFVVCGSGQDEHKLKTLAKELGVEERVHWRGHVDNADLPRHLQHADIFVRPSRSEGFGISFVEAFAAGLPVIATREGGLADFITPDTAYPVRPESAEDIAAAVRSIVENPGHKTQVVARARALVEERYNWDIIAKDMQEKIFAKLI